MATLPDSAGLVTSTETGSLIEGFEQALACLFRADGNALSVIGRVLERSPAFTLGQCLRAGALILRGADTVPGALAASVAAIDADTGASEREKRHGQAARRWLDGDTAGASWLYGELLRDDPRDRLALLVAHALDFRLGRRDLLRDRIAGVLAHWDVRDGEYGYLLGMHAFGLEENGNYRDALTVARESLAFIPDNAAAIHVIAHVFEMTSTPDRGIAWLRATQPIWAANAGFRVHIAWHLALFQFDAGEADNALSTYDDLIAPHLDEGNNSLVDASALLWRLQLLGSGSRWRWRDVTARWMQQRTIGGRAFELVHAVMAMAASRQHRRARKLAARLQADTMLRARSGKDELSLAEPLMAAIIAFSRGRYDAAVESICAVRAMADRCGGSVAQCDLVHLTLIEAALRGHQNRLARTLAAERTARKPASGLNRWLSARAWTRGTAKMAAARA